MLSGGGGTCDFRQSELSCGRKVREARHGTEREIKFGVLGRGVFFRLIFLFVRERPVGRIVSGRSV